MDQAQAIQALSALAHESRLEIVRLLVRRGAEGMCAGGIGKLLGLPASGLSFHLSALEQAGLVSAERRGRQVIYRSDKASLGRLIGYLLDDCCHGDPDIGRCSRR